MSNQMEEEQQWKRGGVRNFARNLRIAFGLESGTDIEGTIARIRAGVRLRGANLWILMCAAIIASIGLNTSSVAIIIGAMLISPLMGPILGIGLGVATHDQRMLYRALRTFGIAVLISLVTSTLYFLVTPITSPTSELLSRTSPTILDVGVALFGGIAGIVAGSRRESTTAIPGVAIATALMPPLCTVGYGLAQGQWSFVLGAFYLFFLNAVFISLATFLVARLLKFPHEMQVGREVKRRVDRFITALVIVTMLPSVVIFSDVINDFRRRGAAERFVRQELEHEGHTVVNWGLENRDSVVLLRVYLAGAPLAQSAVDSLQALLPDRGLAGTRLRLVQLNLPQEQEQISAGEVLELLKSSDLQQELMENLAAAIDTSRNGGTPLGNVSVERLTRELRAAFPEVDGISFSRELQQVADTSNAADSSSGFIMFWIRQQNGAGKRIARESLERMRQFLMVRLELDTAGIMEVATVATPGR